MMCVVSRWSGLFLLPLLFVFVCAAHAADGTAYKVFKDEYIVQFSSEQAQADVAADLDTQSDPVGERLEEQYLRNGKKITLYRKDAAGNGNYDVQAAGSVVQYDQQEVKDFCDELAKSVTFELCEPNAPLSISTLPEDELYESLYGMDKIQAPKAWDLSTGSVEVVVGVLDTGVDYTHPDLKDNMWVNEGEIPNNGKDDDNNGYVDDVYGYDFYNNDGDPYDDNGHGTHVAGTIGAVGNNSIGVVGVNWNVRIMALKFLSGSGSGSTLDAVTGIDFAIGHGLDVINASFGGTFPSNALEQSIKRARDAGVLFVAAAGNSAKNTDNVLHYPSCYDIDNIVSVAATDADDNLAYFSNYGAQTVDIAAPGVAILSTVPGGYSSLSGTSMASPHVAGLAALIKSYKPELNYLGLKNTILNTKDTLLSLSGVVATSGRINAYAALSGDGSSSPVPQKGVRIDRFGHRNNSQVLYKRKNFRMVFRGEPGEQFTARLSLDGIFDGSCNLGTFQIPSDGELRLKSRFTLRGWMWYTKSATLQTSSDSATRQVRKRRGARYRRNARFSKRFAERLSQARSDLGSRYSDLSCEQIQKLIRAVK